MSQLLVVLVDGINYSAWLFLTAVGLTLIYGVMKILNVAHGSFYSLGAYVAASSMGFWFSHGYPPYLSFVALAISAFVAGFVVGPLLERVMLRPQYAKDEVVILLITYGLFLVLEDVIKVIWGVDPYYVSEPYELLGMFELGGMTYPRYYLLMAGLAITVGLGLLFLLKKKPISVDY